MNLKELVTKEPEMWIWEPVPDGSYRALIKKISYSSDENGVVINLDCHLFTDKIYVMRASIPSYDDSILEIAKIYRIYNIPISEDLDALVDNDQYWLVATVKDNKITGFWRGT